MSDNKSLEPFFNDDVSDADGTKRNLRVVVASNPIDGYHPANSAQVQLDGINYYGYLNADGAYYIMKEVVSNSGLTRVYTYTAGSSGYSTAWTNRATESYASFADTF